MHKEEHFFYSAHGKDVLVITFYNHAVYADIDYNGEVIRTIDEGLIKELKKLLQFSKEAVS